jgi:hypothetical protein
MPDPRAELSETYAEMGDAELMERWSDGNLTEVAMEVARGEFAKRGMAPPQIKPQQNTDALADSGEAVTLVTVARSLVPTQLHILQARLEAEGIPSFVVDADITRMNSLWAVAVGGARLLVPERHAAEAQQIIAYVRAGRFALGEGEDVG